MSYRAGKRDFVVATGADSSFAVRFHSRGPQVAVDTIIAGEFILYEGAVWPVFSNTAMGTDKTELVLGFGNFYDPRFVLDDSDQVTRADPATWEAVDMQVAMPDTSTSPAPTTMTVPTSLADEGQTCIILIDSEWLEPFQQAIDYAEGGPSGMSLPFDLVGVIGGQRTRVLQGSLIVVRSAASTPVPPPNLEGS